MFLQSLLSLTGTKGWELFKNSYDLLKNKAPKLEGKRGQTQLFVRSCS